MKAGNRSLPEQSTRSGTPSAPPRPTWAMRSPSTTMSALVPLILGFNPNTVIFFSGVATLLFLVVTGFKVPSYLGSSFSFIGSVLAVQGANNPNHGLAYAGIVIAGVIYLIIGGIVHVVGV